MIMGERVDQEMVNSLFGWVIWIPLIPENEGDIGTPWYPTESQTTGPPNLKLEGWNPTKIHPIEKKKHLNHALPMTLGVQGVFFSRV